MTDDMIGTGHMFETSDMAGSGDTVGTRLMIFLTEDDRSGHRSLHEALLQRAREDGVAGATVWRGIEGFGSSGHLRTTRSPDLVRGLPLVFEIIDAAERVEAFLEVVGEMAPGSLVTKESVRMRRRRPGRGVLDDPVPAPRS